MPRNYSKYQYETSPRKLAPEYTPKKEPYKKKTTAKNLKKEEKNKPKKETLSKRKKAIVKYMILGFALLFAISYRNAKIDESFSQVQTLKDELSSVKKENTQLEIEIEDSLNLNNIEQEAKELLGMQKLTSKQTVYITLPKTDYIETAAEEVVIDGETSPLENILNTITNIFK